MSEEEVINRLSNLGYKYDLDNDDCDAVRKIQDMYKAEKEKLKVYKIANKNLKNKMKADDDIRDGRYIHQDIIKQKYISKDKIKEKIEEIKSIKENYIFQSVTSEDIRETIITNLQELLEE